MSSADTLTTDDHEFLAKCEEELKDRFTENDAAFMKVFNLESSVPPIVESWWVPNNRRGDRRQNRSYRPYERHGGGGGGGGGRARDNYDGRNRRDWDDRRGYGDHNRGYNDRGYGGYQQRSRY